MDIESRTGQIDFALDLLKLGQTYNIDGLDDLLLTLLELYYLVYQPSMKYSMMTLEDFKKLSNADTINRLLDGLRMDHFGEDFHATILPFLTCVDVVKSEERKQKFKEILAHKLITFPQIAVIFFEECAIDVFSVQEQKKLILEYIHHKPSFHSFEYSERLLHSLSKMSNESQETVEYNLGQSIECLKILSVYGIDKDILWIEQMKDQKDIQLGIIRKILHTMNASQSEIEWRNVFNDILKIISLEPFKAVTIDIATTEFFSSLLTSCCFGLAKHILYSKSGQVISKEARENAILDAARSFFDNSTLCAKSSKGMIAALEW